MKSHTACDVRKCETLLKASRSNVVLAPDDAYLHGVVPLIFEVSAVMVTGGKISLGTRSYTMGSTTKYPHYAPPVLDAPRIPISQERVGLSAMRK